MCISPGHHELAVEPYSCSYGISHGIYLGFTNFIRSYDIPDASLFFFYRLGLYKRYSDIVSMRHIWSSRLCCMDRHNM